MPRYERVASNVLYQPARLTLNSAAHRASLDGSDVAVLSGVDPGTEGTLRRAPGGKAVWNLGLSSYPYRKTRRLYCCDRTGVSAHWFQKTVLTAAEGAFARTAGVTLDVAYGLTFTVGDCIVLYTVESAASVVYILFVTAVTKNTIVATGSVNYGSNIAESNAFASGCAVQEAVLCAPVQVTGGTYVFQAGAGFTVYHPCGLVPGMKVWVAAHSDDTTPDTRVAQARTVVSVTKNTGAFWTVKLDADVTVSSHVDGWDLSVALVPHRVSMSTAGMEIVTDEQMYLLTGGSQRTEFDGGEFSQGTDIDWRGNEFNSEDGEIRMTPIGSRYFVEDGRSRPFQLLLESTQARAVGQTYSGTLTGDLLDPVTPDHGWAIDALIGSYVTIAGVNYLIADNDATTITLTTGHGLGNGVKAFTLTAEGQRLPCCRIGAESIQVQDTASFRLTTGTGSMSSGIHKVFIRLVDKRATPYGYSPPVYTHEQTSTGTDGVQIHPQNFCYYVDEDYGRYTHYEIWATLANGDTYFRMYQGPIGSLVYSVGGSGGIPAAALTTKGGLADTALVFLTSLATNGRDKGLPPICKFIHYADGICFYGGKPYATPTQDDTSFAQSDSVIYFSRTDAEEPENVPAENFKVVSASLGRLHGFVNTQGSVLALYDNGYVSIQRLGTYLVFTEDATHGCGCQQDEAFVSSKTHAVWWGSEAIWIYDPGSMVMPMNLGKPIRDWVKLINEYARSYVDLLVRFGLDPEHGVLYVNATNGDKIAEGMVYSFGQVPEGFDWSAGTWCKREDWPVECMSYCRGVDSASRDYTLFATQKDTVLVAQDWYNQPIAHGWTAINGTDKITGVLEGTVAAGDVAVLASAGPHLHLTNTVAFTLANSVVGACISFWRVTGDSVELVGRRVIRSCDGATNTSVDLSSAITVLEGDRWIIGGIPWKVRFPPIRGEDPFVRKVASGAQVIVGDISTDKVSAAAGHDIFINFLDNLRTTTRTGGADSSLLPLSGYSRVAMDPRAAGEIIEVEVYNYLGHFRADLLYVGVPVTSEGVFKSVAV